MLLNRRQRKSFKDHKVGFYSFVFLLFLLFLAVAANLIANSKPFYFKYKEKSYFPMFHTPTTADLGLEGTFLEVNFKKLNEEEPLNSFGIWPLISFGPNESDRSLETYPSKPSRQHWLGTDDRGRDVAARLLYGLRNSLVFSIAVWLISFFIGTVVGAAQGYVGGRLDFYCQRLIEILSSLPQLFLLIILVSIFKPSLTLLIVFMSLLGWIGISYYVRVEFLKLRALEYVEAAKSLGVSRIRLLSRHVFPNALTPLITFSPFALTAGITGLAGLDYLGLGLSPPAASWGEMLNQAQKHFDHAWWLAVFPSLALMSTLLILNFIGEALREALDPRNGI